MAQFTSPSRWWSEGWTDAVQSLDAASPEAAAAFAQQQAAAQAAGRQGGGGGGGGGGGRGDEAHTDHENPFGFVFFVSFVIFVP